MAIFFYSSRLSRFLADIDELKLKLFSDLGRSSCTKTGCEVRIVSHSLYSIGLREENLNITNEMKCCVALCDLSFHSWLRVFANVTANEYIRVLMSLV